MMNMVDYVLKRSRAGIPFHVNTADMTIEGVNALITLFPHLRANPQYSTMIYFTDQKHLDDYLNLLRVLE